jgi:radical SAM superfamily enzyme YgiQ (UPF0313 family)
MEKIEERPFKIMRETELSFEQGPIRPPNEAQSFLLRITRNCPWNQCMFCPVYKKKKFSLRTVEEIKQDIQTAKDIADDVKALRRSALFLGILATAIVTGVSLPGFIMEQGLVFYRMLITWL